MRSNQGHFQGQIIDECIYFWHFFVIFCFLDLVLLERDVCYWYMLPFYLYKHVLDRLYTNGFSSKWGHRRALPSVKYIMKWPISLSILSFFDNYANLCSVSQISL